MLFFSQDMLPTPVNGVVLTAAAPSSAQRTMNYGICEFIHAWDEHSAYDKGFYVPLHAQYLAVEFLPKNLREGFYNNSPVSDEAKLVFDWIDKVIVKRLSEPQHGVLLYDDQDKYRYVPSKGYFGKDRVDFLLEGKDLSGRSFSAKVNYYINVLPEAQFDSAIRDDESHRRALKKYCGVTKGRWRTSDNYGASPFTVGLPGHDYVTPVITFADLNGAAVGEAKGEGVNATITRDTTAGGHGWFIDYTPYLNQEFLPTANPNERRFE